MRIEKDRKGLMVILRKPPNSGRRTKNYTEIKLLVPLSLPLVESPFAIAIDENNGKIILIPADPKKRRKIIIEEEKEKEERGRHRIPRRQDRERKGDKKKEKIRVEKRKALDFNLHSYGKEGLWRLTIKPVKTKIIHRIPVEDSKKSMAQ